MERQVIFRDRQEFRDDDVNNIQIFTDEFMQHLILDAITGERMYVGLTVTPYSSTEIAISNGRLWVGDEGKVYRKDQVENLSLFSYIPIQDEKWLAVSVLGQEQETDIQARDYLIDLQTQQTEPRAAAMERQRVAISHITEGLESAAPQKPAPPTGYTLIAYVRLAAGGIQEIIQNENVQLMRLFDVWQTTKTNASWLAAYGPILAALQSDIADLRAYIAGMKPLVNYNELASDVAVLKDLSDLPDTYASYGGDVFLSEDESETGDAEYYARVDEGIRFPWAGQTDRQMTLYNQYETAVINHGGLILPAYTQEVRLAVTGKSGDLAIGQYTYTTHEMKLGCRTRRRIRFGPTREVCTNGKNWETGMANATRDVFGVAGYQEMDRYGEHGGHHWMRVRRYWVDYVREPYWFVETVNHNINGSQVAQTFRASSSGWLTGINLYITNPASDGIIYLHVTECNEVGEPVKNHCIGRAEMNPADLKVYPLATYFEMLQPVFLQAGKRYAFTATTAGDHKAATVEGSRLASGTLFHSTDGAYFQGDLTKDLMFDLVFAKFNSARVSVELEPIDLADGIADLDMLMEAIVPEGCDLTMEFQKSGDGTWYPVNADNAGQLLGLPALLKLRLTFVGSADSMPGIDLSNSRIQANRPAVTAKHISTPRILPAASENIDVIVDLEAHDPAKHACTVKLLSGGAAYTADSYEDQDRTVNINGEEIPARRITYNFLPEPGTGISDYQIQIELTSTTALDICHVAKRMDISA